ncbi:MAG: hypothetical protein JWN86_401 [Planctomycetota bacterium]|nr:hypothetical protein [Planctomycetota bacterium]
MLSCFVSLWMAAAVGQAPSGQSAWLKSVPADVVAVVRVKSLETVRDDLLKMLEAMSPNAAALAKPQIEQGLEMFAASQGKPATQHPFFTIFRLPKDGVPVPPFAVLVESDSYLGVLKSISKKDDIAPKSLGGYDSFDGADGQTWYAYKGAGFVAFGPDEALIKAVSKPSASLAEKISDELKAGLLGGDIGLYVNIASIQAQYADQIEGGKQMIMGVLDQAGAQMAGNMQESVKSMYAAMFDSLKIADALAFNLDFATEGLGISGLATVKADSAAGKGLASATVGSAEKLGMLPADSSAFIYMKINPEGMSAMQKFGISFLTGSSKPSPELEKALALQAEAGMNETYSANISGGTVSGMESLTIATPKDPEKAVEAMIAVAKAMKSGQGFVKDVVIAPKALIYKGFTFTSTKMTLDLEKMVTPGAPGGVEGMKKMLGGDTITAYYGTDGKTVLSVAAKTVDEAKHLVDVVLSGEGTIGKTPNFAAVRGKLPKQATALFLLSAQGLIKQSAQQMSATLGKGDIKVPADLPKDPALLGAALVASPKGFSFQLVVPSNVGPIFEKGLVPIIQSLTGQIQ